MRLKLSFPVLMSVLMTAGAPKAQTSSQQPWEVRPPVTQADLKIVRRARAILNSPAKWNRADNRICPESEKKFSLYCALEEATYEVTNDFAHRGAAMQEARFVIEDLDPNWRRYHHRLMDYNNDPGTTFADVQRFFDLLQGRVEGRIEEEETIAQVIAPKPESITEADIEVVKKVEAILGSPAKWDKSSTFRCEKDAATFGLYCAFEAASIAVTGKSDNGGPGIAEVRQLISRTAPNAERYNARLIDYNNDPTVTFEDMQRLLKTVEINLEKRMALQKKHVSS
jgi:hypothetical protein